MVAESTSVATREPIIVASGQAELNLREIAFGQERKSESLQLELCKEHQGRIQLLITDMVIPGLGGLELAKVAVELRPGLAVVLVSGYTGRALDSEATSIGA
jgi:two-component SAPR family response regulator